MMEEYRQGVAQGLVPRRAHLVSRMGDFSRRLFMFATREASRFEAGRVLLADAVRPNESPLPALERAARQVATLCASLIPLAAASKQFAVACGVAGADLDALEAALLGSASSAEHSTEAPMSTEAVESPSAGRRRRSQTISSGSDLANPGARLQLEVHSSNLESVQSLAYQSLAGGQSTAPWRAVPTGGVTTVVFGGHHRGLRSTHDRGGTMTAMLDRTSTSADGRRTVVVEFTALPEHLMRVVRNELIACWPSQLADQRTRRR
jgi:hypothetical protein